MKFAADFESFLIANVNLDQNRLDGLQQKVDAIESFVESDATSQHLLRRDSCGLSGRLAMPQ